VAVDAAQMLVTIGARMDGLDAGLASMDRKLSQSARGAEQHTSRIASAFGRASRNILAYGGLATIGVVVGGVVRNAMSLEKTLSSLAAVSGATGKQMTAFKHQAVAASMSTKFSSTEAASAMVELAKGGVAVGQIGPSLKGVARDGRSWRHRRRRRSDGRRQRDEPVRDQRQGRDARRRRVRDRRERDDG
jgi:hypothetical protein